MSIQGIIKLNIVAVVLLFVTGTTLATCISDETHQQYTTATGTDFFVNSHPRSIGELPPMVEWNITYGGEKTQFPYEVQQTSDGGYIIGGWTKSFGIARCNPWLLKTDDKGIELWNKTYSYYSLANMSGYIQAVQETPDHGYILGCTFFSSVKTRHGFISSIVLIKTDSSGTELWNKTYPGLQYSNCYCVRLTSDGGYIATGGGNYSADNPTNLYLLKTTADGTMQWLKTFGTADMYEEGHAVQQTSDGGYIVSGESDLDYSVYWGKIWLIKTDTNGVATWDKKFGDANSYGNSVQQTTDGGYIITGINASLGCLLKTDANGNEQWRKTPFLTSAVIFEYSGKQTTDGGYIATGLDLLKTDADGNEEWNVTILQPFISGEQTSDGGYIIVGSTNGYYGGDIWLIKFGPEPRVTYTVKGGHGISLKMTNTGTVDANGVAWEVLVSGGILHRINKTASGTIDIPTGESKTELIKSFFGFGAITVTATVNGKMTTKTGFQFLTFSLII